MKMREKLNWFHIAILIYAIELDVLLFVLPRISAENLGTNGWIGLLLLSGAALFNVFMISLVFRLGRGASVFDIMEASLPRALLYPLYLVLAGFWLFVGSLVGKNYILIYQMISFPTTDPMMLYLLFCFMLYFLLAKGIYGISKATTMIFFLTAWMPLLNFYFFGEWKAVRMTPYIFQGAVAIEGGLHNWAELFTVFVGYELCMFLFPFVEKDGKWLRGVYIGHLFATGVYLLVLVTAYGFFSLQQLQLLKYPIINLLAYIELPFINRIENITFTFFLFTNLASAVMFCFASVQALRRVIPHARPKLLEFIVVCLAYGIAFLPNILRKSELWLRNAYFIEIGLSFAAPVFLLLLLWWQRHRERRLHS